MKQQQHKNLVSFLSALARRAADEGNYELAHEADDLVTDATVAYLKTYGWKR